MSHLPEIVLAGLGIAGTLIAWFFNPSRRRMNELFDIEKGLKELGQKRDKALNEKDNDTLTIVTADIAGLLSRRNKILQRK
jgi:hypothetical protein